MRDFSSRGKKVASATAVATLVVAASATATSATQANPDKSRVIVSGTASCERFEDSSVTDVSITPTGKDAKTAELSGEDTKEKYKLTFTGVPKLPKSWQANATVNCVDSEDDTHTFSKSFKIQRPAGTTETQTLNLK